MHAKARLTHCWAAQRVQQEAAALDSNVGCCLRQLSSWLLEVVCTPLAVAVCWLGLFCNEFIDFACQTLGPLYTYKSCSCCANAGRSCIHQLRL